MSASSEMQDPNVPTKDNVACSPAPLCNTAAEKHSPQKTELKRHKCIVCFKEFKRKVYLKDHMSVHTGVLTAREKRRRELRHTCIVCGKGFRWPSLLKEHMKVHTGVCDYECEICGKKFCQRKALQLHTLTHSTDRPYECKLCTTTFKRPNALRRHLLMIHEGKRQIKCSDCNRYYFPTEGSEAKHAKKYHVGENYRIDEKPFKCELCDAQFKEHTHFRLHVETVHSDERPFLCTVCGKTYKSKGSLRIHSVIHMEAGKVRAECKICHRVLKATSMYQHMKYHEEKKFLCNFCGKRFTMKHQLNAHVKSHLGLKEHACDLSCFLVNIY